jgi:hypothetical protein
MEKHSSPIQLTKRHAAFRLRQLLDEFHLLMASFPDLQDAFDADELPLAFILRRDSRLSDPGVQPSETLSRRPNNSVRRQTRSSRTPDRGGRRKQMSDD